MSSGKKTLYSSHGEYQASENLEELQVLTTHDELRFQANPLRSGIPGEPVVVSINISLCKWPKKTYYWILPEKQGFSHYRHPDSETPCFSVKMDGADPTTFTECIRLSINDEGVLEVQLCDLEGAWNDRDPFKSLETYEVLDGTPVHEWFQRHGNTDFQQGDKRNDEIEWEDLSTDQTQTLQYYRPTGFTNTLMTPRGTPFAASNEAGPAAKSMRTSSPAKGDKQQRISLLELVQTTPDLIQNVVPDGHRRSFMQTSSIIHELARQNLPIKIGSKRFGDLDNIIQRLPAYIDTYNIASIRISHRAIEGFDKRGFQQPYMAQGLATVLARASKTLKNLQLDYDNIDDNAMGILAAGIQQCTALTQLGLFANKIGNMGLTKLAEVLPHCVSLRNLNLRDNKFLHEGIARLAEVLPQCTALTYLNLSSNNIGHQGIEVLAPALPRCPRLRHLHLSHCMLQNTGVASLAAVLEQCLLLEHLTLGLNGIDSDGIEALVHGLEQCPALTYVELETNNIEERGRQLLMRLVSRKRMMRIQVDRYDPHHVTPRRMVVVRPVIIAYTGGFKV
jgi:hypothetical protein